ncbi:hypothetical protein GCM10025785_17750 [Corynebacterium canis]
MALIGDSILQLGNYLKNGEKQEILRKHPYPLYGEIKIAATPSRMGMREPQTVLVCLDMLANAGPKHNA